MSKGKRKPGEWIDDARRAKIIFDGSYRRVRFNDGRIGLCAMTNWGLKRLTDKYWQGNMRGFNIRWLGSSSQIYMAIQK